MDKMEVKKIDSANLQVSATISKKTIDEHIEKGAKVYAKEVKIEGFRKGKVPTAIVKQRFAKELLDEAKSSALRDLVTKALKEQKIDSANLVGEPRVSKFDEKSKDELQSGDIDVSIDVFVKPSFKIDGYKDLIPDIKLPKASKDEVKKQIEQSATNFGEIVDDEKAKELKKDDYALFDFEGFVDGVAFEGGKAQNHSLQIGSGSFIPGFEDAMIGMKVGEDKDIDVTFPKEYGEKSLAGKKAVFKIKLHKIQKKQSPKIDDELAKKLLPQEKDATLKLLEEKTQEQIEAQKKMKYFNDEVKPKFIENLEKKYSFDLPQISIEREINNLLAKKSNEMSKEEIEEISKNKDKLNKLKTSCEGDAKKTVKMAFIIQAMIEAEGIEVSDSEVQQTIYYEAMYSGQDPQQALKYYQEKGYMPMVKMNMAEQKLFLKLFDEKTQKPATKTPSKAKSTTSKDA